MQDDRFDDYDYETRHAVLSYEAMRKGLGNIFLDPVQIANVIAFYLDNDEIEEARGALDYGLNIYPHNEELAEEEIRILIAEGETEQAVALLETRIQQHPESAELYILLGTAYEDSDCWEEAREAYEKSLKIEPKDADALFFLVIVLIKQNKLSEALQYCKQAFRVAGEEIDENRFPLLFFDTVSQVFSELQRDKEAISFFENIVFQNPLIAEGWDVLASHKMKLYAQEGDMEMASEAVEAMEHCIAIQPDNEEYYIRLSEYHITLEHFAIADDILQEASQRFPDDQTVIFQRGQLCHLQQNFVEAIKYYREAKAKGFDGGILWSNLAHCHTQLGHTKIALQAMHMAIEKSPDDKTVILNCAATAELLQLRELSEMLYDRALKIAPDEPGIYNFRASTLINEEKYDEAVHALERTLENGLFDSITYILLCTALYHMREFDRLFFYLEEGMKESPFYLRLLHEYSPEIFEDPSVLLFIESVGKDETMKQLPYNLS